MTKLKLVAALGALAAILAVPAWGAGAKATETITTVTPQITVNGSGSVTAVPDIAVWSFSVSSRATGAREALKLNGVEMRKVIAALKATGIAASDLRTSQVNLSSRSNQDGTSIIGYEASNSVTVKVRKAASTGEIVDAAVEAGADGVSGPSFQVSGQAALYRQALAVAFDDAKAKATRLAQQGGLTLGKAIVISEQGSSQPIFYAPGVAKAAAADSTPVEAGESEVQANVTVTFAIS
jgi:hypothetical protein